MVETFLGVKNWQTLAALWAGALSCNKKNPREQKQLDEPVECASGKFCIYCFSLWYEFFVHYTLRVEKKLSAWSWCGTFRISVSSAEGMSHQPIHNSVTLFRGRREKHQVSSPVIILLKRILSASAMAIISWQDLARSSLCSGVK